MAPAKRAAEPLAISQEATHKECLEWLGNILTTEQFSQASQALEERGELPDGAVLLSCDETDLRELGLNFTLSRKVHQKLQEVRTFQATQTQQESPPSGSTTPLMDSADPLPQQMDLATAGTTVKRGRGRPRKTNRQTRLTPLDLDRAGPSKPTRGAARSSRLNKPSRTLETTQDEGQAEQRQEQQVEDDAIEVLDSEDDDQDDDPGAHQQVGDDEDYVAEVHVDTENNADMDVDGANDDDDEETIDDRRGGPSRRTRNASRRRQSGRHVGAAATAAQRPAANNTPGDATEDDDEEDHRPEEADDGVKPSNTSVAWKTPAFEGLEIMLKMMPMEDLLSICEEKDYESVVWRYKRRNEFGQQLWKTRSRAAIATNITKMVFFNSLKTRTPEDGGTTWEGVDEFVDAHIGEQYIVAYLNETLKRQVATPPRISEPRKLLWRLWARMPEPPQTPSRVYLGRITFPVVYVGPELVQTWQAKVNAFDPECEEETEQEAYLDINAIKCALEAADEAAAAAADVEIKMEGGGVIKSEELGGQGDVGLRFPTNGDTDYYELIGMLINLNRHGSGLKCRCRLDLVNNRLFVDLTAEMKTRGELLVRGVYVQRAPGFEPMLLVVWLDRILQAMDHLKGTDFVDKDMEALNAAWDQACDDLETRDVELQLEPPHSIDFNMFDKIMAGVENIQRDMEPGVEQECADRISLRLKPYQKHALSFMMREEKAPGGTARHLWLKVPLPGDQPGVQAWVSPALFQLYVSKSQLATDQALGTCGGAGWQALEMGMGKTAVILAGTLFNPPPQGWRARRPWKPYDPTDYMATYIDNMPRGGTLVIVPSTLVRQWQIEIEKTLDNPAELSVLTWTEAHRSTDCNEIARYDLVITTPQLATRNSTLPSIFWHRVVIDEAQLNAGSLMKSGTLRSTHRWIVTGTPCNAQPETLGPSLEFLRLGGYDAAQKHMPPALTTVLRAVMCRYTKNGTINGRTNLDLPPLTERVLSMEMLEEEQPFVQREGWTHWQALYKHIKTGLGRYHRCDTVEELLADTAALNALTAEKKVKISIANKHFNAVKALVGGGGKGVPSGEVDYNERTGNMEPVLINLQSKAQAVLDDLLELREREPEAKVLVFSEYAETLNALGRLLIDEGLHHRTLLGSTSFKKRGEAIEAFMTDPPTRIFLLQAKAGGVGITLTAASHVYLCEPLMNPGLELQAIGRSRRMGQTKTVTVTRVYAAGTIEERIRTVLARRCGGRTMASTAGMVGADEVHCSVGDIVEMLKCEDPEQESGSEDAGAADGAEGMEEEEDDGTVEGGF